MIPPWCKSITRFSTVFQYYSRATIVWLSESLALLEILPVCFFAKPHLPLLIRCEDVVGDHGDDQDETQTTIRGRRGKIQNGLTPASQDGNEEEVEENQKYKIG